MLCVYHVTSLPLPIKEWRLWALEPCIVKKIWNMDLKGMRRDLVSWKDTKTWEMEITFWFSHLLP